MDLDLIILSEVSQKEKDKCHMITFRCGECQGVFQSNLSPNGKIREALIYGNRHVEASVVAQMVKNLPAVQETGV